MCDKGGELRPLQDRNLTLAVEIVAPLGRNTHLIELLYCLGISDAAERRLDRLQHSNVRAQQLQLFMARLQRCFDDMTRQPFFNIQQYLQVPEADLRLNQYKLGKMAMVSAWLSPVTMIDRVDTAQSLAVNQWLQVQLCCLRQEGFVAEVVKREQRRKILASTSKTCDRWRCYLYKVLRLHEIANKLQ